MSEGMDKQSDSSVAMPPAPPASARDSDDSSAPPPASSNLPANGSGPRANVSGGQRTVLKELGGFELIEKVGQGGMGTVFKARQKSLDRVVALKVLPTSFSKNKKFIDRFQSEARASAKLSHPNIVQGIDVGCDAATSVWYFAMEFVDGPTLRQVLKEQRVIPEQRALKTVQDVARALDCIARAGMVHRDIKPENILLTKSGVVKLADLGLATEVNVEDPLTPQANQTVGTPHYMAPEQVRGQRDKVDIRSDIYALGATLFHLVTGQRPFTGNSAAELMAKHLNEMPPKASDINKEVSQACSKLILKMMAKEIDKRVQTPQALLEEIERIVNPAASKTGPYGAVTTGPRAAVGTGPRGNVTTGPRSVVRGTTGPRDAVEGMERLRPVEARQRSNQMLYGIISLALVVAGAVALAFRSSTPSNANPTTPGKVAVINPVPAAPVVAEAPVTPVAPAKTEPEKPADKIEIEKPAAALAKPVEPAPVVPPAKVTEVKEPVKPVEPAKVVVEPAKVVPEPATPVPPVPEPAKVEVNPAARAAYAKVFDEYLAALSQGNRKAAADHLDKAEKMDALKALRGDLLECRAELAEFTELDRAVEAGAMKIDVKAGYELRGQSGAPWQVGGASGFAVLSAKDGTIILGNKDVNLPVPVAKLHPSTYRRLAELGMGESPEAQAKLTLPIILDVHGGRETEAVARAAIEKARAGGASESKMRFLTSALDEITKDGREASAQTAFDELTKLAAAKQWTPLKTALDAFQKQHGSTDLATKKAAEIAALQQKALSAEMIMKGLMVWLKADAGVTLQEGKVSAWRDLSGHNWNAIQPNPAERPTVVANALQGAPAIHFDGISSVLLIHQITGPMKSFTVSFTLRPLGQKNFNQYIGSGWGRFCFHSTGDGGIFIGTSVQSRISPNEGPKPGTLVKDTWTQITYVCDQGKGMLYKNGKEIATKNMAPSVFNGFNLGSPDAGTINGDMSEFCFYDRALADAEIQVLEKLMMRDEAVHTSTPPPPPAPPRPPPPPRPKK